ncbi:MAG: TetR/AcrR family transcriptional regulator [Deltaproteobacteria bacterium]|nr:TetR/AcrR family transcriptional regulator [Deltaproteobacteria bacterium]
MTKSAEEKRQETREKIVGAACELFSQHGYHDTQVMDIVRAVGMSAGTFYNYFVDKRDLFEQITIEGLKNLRIHIKMLRKPVDIWDREERITIIRETLTAIFDYVDANPQQLLMLLRGSFGVDKELNINVWNYFSGFAEDVAEDIQDWINEGVIEGISPILFGHAALGMCLQLIHGYLVENRMERDEIIENLIRLILAMFETYLTEKGRAFTE